MLRWTLVFLVAAAAFGQDHERVAASQPIAWRWDAGIDVSLTPFPGGSLGSGGLGGSVTFADQWAAAASLPWSWWNTATMSHSERGPVLVSVSWLGGEPAHRWTVRASRAANRWSGDIGVRVSRDPLVWGMAASGAAARETREISLTLSIQEVLNDESSYSYGFSPSVFWDSAGPHTGLAVQWTLSWYSRDWTLSSGIAATGALWTWVGSILRTGQSR